MHDQVYLRFFLLCTILSQGIFANPLEEDVGESSKLLVRHRRVISRSHEEGETPLTNGDAPYVVNLRRFSRLHCIASILSQHTIITAARCVGNDLSVYSVLSGTSYTHRGNEHIIIGKKTRGHNPGGSSIFLKGIALITVDPPFIFSFNTRAIGLHSGPVLAGMEGTIAGWGTRVNLGPAETVYPKRLRTITVPIKNHRECQNIYRGRFPITDEEVCTYHPQKLCGDTDAGAALVMDNQLAGVYIGPIDTSGIECPIKPDVFILLQHLNYGSWIRENILH